MNVDDLSGLLKIPELPIFIQQVDELLVSFVDSSDISIHQPCLRLIRSSGKRLRPLLAGAVVYSQKELLPEKVIQAGAAIELMHLASLIHDDIIDKAAVRHGVATISSREGLSAAILAGDYLIAQALTQAATIDKAIAGVLATALADMCEGQNLELIDAYNPARTVENYLSTVRNKTAALMSAACRIGGMCVSLPDTHIKAFAKFGEAFGMSYQLTDDLLDVLSTYESTGKPVGNDMQAGTYTLPVLLALQGDYRSTVKSWLGKKPNRRPSMKQVSQTLQSSGSIDKTIDTIRTYNKVADNALLALKPNPIIEALRQLPDAYMVSVLSRSN